MKRGEQRIAVGLRGTHALAVVVLGLFGTAPAHSANNMALAPGGGQACLQPGDSVVLPLTVAGLLQSINGVQALIRYDPARLSLTAVLPGDGGSSPWQNAFVTGPTPVDEQTIAVGLLIFGGTQLDATVARLEFQTLAVGVPEVFILAGQGAAQSKFTAYPSGVTVLPTLGEPITLTVAAFGDGDADGDVDLTDYQSLAGCWTGPGDPNAAPGDLPADCVCFDADQDGDLDLEDFAAFQMVYGD